MHIGIHCFEYPPCHHGGIGSFTRDLAEGLIKEGHDVTVFGVYYKNVQDIDSDIAETINGVKVYRYPQYNRFKNARLNLIASRFFLYHQVKKLHSLKPFDMIETPENEGWFPFAFPYGIPMLTRFHGGVTYFGKELRRNYSRLASLFEKWQIIRSSKLISVSNYTAHKTLEYFNIQKKYDVIYNSVTLPKTDECKEENGHTILFSGSVIPKKGIESLVRSMQYTWEEFPEAKLIIAGKNIFTINGEAYEEYLYSLIEEEKREQVIFTGSLHREKELVPLMCKATLCCYPSFSEAFSLAPLEAMALGKPVVYSKLHSGPEAIDDGVDGLLCDPNDPIDIAEKIVRLLRDGKLRKKLGANAKMTISNRFSYDKWIDRNIQMYKEVLSNGK